MRTPLLRTALVLLAAGACGRSGRPAPPPPARPPPPSPAPVIEDAVWRVIRVCVVEDGTPRAVRAEYNLLTGDTLVGGRPFAEAHPATAASAWGARWFVENEPIVLDGRRFIKYGVPRVLGPEEVAALGRTHRGVPLFVEAEGEPFPSGVLYVPVRPACEFQSYQWDLTASGVRG